MVIVRVSCRVRHVKMKDVMVIMGIKSSNASTIEVTVDRSQWTGLKLGFLELGQRHFEKELPEPIAGAPVNGPTEFRLPVDFVRMVMPTLGGITDAIEEILVAYGNKA